MTPLPKRRFSIGRQARRRINLKLKTPQTVKCENCGTQKRAHFVCANCGK